MGRAISMQALSGAAPAAAIVLRQVSKTFGDFTALSAVNFEIGDNEFFTLLGPSGCGKTTLLRLIAGFEDTTGGTIHLYGEEIGNLPPNKRPVNTVFQNYALFPHMTVWENISFGLQMLGWTRKDIDRRVGEMVLMVKLDQFADRKPSRMSGGQQQRVALARAMAPRPRVLLLDEPLSALDLKLRQEMRTELKRLQRETGITFIFVTHDQGEALSLSDRIAVMSAGEIQQIGPPSDIYEYPANRFVAGFIGETNLIGAKVTAVGKDVLTCELSDGEIVHARSDAPVSEGRAGSISLRPEHLTLSWEKPVGESLRGEILEVTYLGTDMQYRVRLSDRLHLDVRHQNKNNAIVAINPGAPVYISIADNAARFLVR